MREFEAGGLCDAGRGAVDRLTGVRTAGLDVDKRAAGLLLVDEDKVLVRGFGVMLWSAEGRRVCPCDAGVLRCELLNLEIDVEASDMGGDGGSWMRGLLGGRSTVSGGVVMRGELADDSGEFSAFLSNVGDSGMEMSDDIMERWRDSYFRTFSWSTSASILTSESSSLRRWDSMRRFSRSCSPWRISSSSITPRSIATLYLDSRSSSEDVVLRAWRSKSSFATSVSRSLNCTVRVVSRNFVISFSSEFCAVLASLLDSRYFLCAACVSGCMRTPEGKKQGIIPGVCRPTYLPLVDLVVQALRLLLEHPLPLLGRVDVLL